MATREVSRWSAKLKWAFLLRVPVRPEIERLFQFAGRRIEARWADFERCQVQRIQQELGHRPTAETIVVIPTFRRPALLQRAVRSALAQEGADVHVVVVDDGGGLPPLPEDSRLTAVSLPENTGRIGVVRNIAIGLSDSRFVAFLDDDNTWTPDHVRRHIGALALLPSDLSYSSVGLVDDDDGLVGELGRPFSRRELRRGNYVDMNAIVVRRERDLHLSRLRRPGTCTRAHDWELVWRMSRSSDPVFIPATTVLYNVSAPSAFQ